MSIKEDRYLAVRDNTVTKANALIQRSRFSLSVQQQKIVLYLISQITPYDEDFKLYEFSIVEFCKLVGIDYENGKNYLNLKQAIKDIADKSIWIKLTDGRETLVRWIEKPYINERIGMIQIRLDKDMKPFLLQLKENFTSYELIYTLRMRSKYSIRLYELIKSIHFHELEEYTKRYTVDELKTLLDANIYKNYRDFHHRALKPAVEEINLYTDKTLSYEAVTRGKKVIAIEFKIDTKDTIERIKLRHDLDKALGGNGQLTLWEMIKDK